MKTVIYIAALLLVFRSTVCSQQIVDTSKYEFVIQITDEYTPIRRASCYSSFVGPEIHRFKVLESNYKFPLNEISIFIDFRIYQERDFQKGAIYQAVLKRKVKDEASSFIEEKDKFLYLFESISLVKSPLYQYQKPLPHNF